MIISKKRKRNGNGNGNGNGKFPYIPRGLAPKRRFVPGFSRTSGYYGRFSRTPHNQYPEKKFHDLDVDDAQVAANGTIQTSGTIIVIPQGVTEKQRIGRKCIIKNINWRYTISIPEQDAQATPASGDTVRVILYLDKQCNGATATAVGILESDNYQSFNNLANKQRFKILMDKTYTLNYAGLASDGAGVVSQAQVQLNDSFFKKCSIPIEYDSTTGAITEIRSNNLGIMLQGQNGSAKFESKMRMRFSD